MYTYRRFATEFPTDEALKKYLKEHPGADKSKHSVVDKERSFKTKPGSSEERREKAYDQLAKAENFKANGEFKYENPDQNASERIQQMLDGVTHAQGIGDKKLLTAVGKWALNFDPNNLWNPKDRTEESKKDVKEAVVLLRKVLDIITKEGHFPKLSEPGMLDKALEFIEAWSDDMEKSRVRRGPSSPFPFVRMVQQQVDSVKKR